MLKTIVTSTILYASTCVDLAVILMMLFSKYPSKSQKRAIYVGQFLSSYLLIGISLFFALILHMIPAKWLLGFLGLIPIGFGLKYLFTRVSEAAEVEEVEAQFEHQQNRSLVGNVLIITTTSCGADNIGLFVPYFISLSTSQLLTTLVVFTIGIGLLVLISDRFASVSVIRTFLSKYSNWIMAVIYIGLGTMILVRSETITHLIQLIK